MKNMYEVRITVLKRFDPQEVFEKSPATPAEPMGICKVFEDGQEFISEGGGIPEGFPCISAWFSLYPFVMTLSFGGNLPWFEEKGISINCCPDGLRPVIYKLERI